MNPFLKRYWFVFDPEHRFGPMNAGVTATSMEEAKSLLLKSMVTIYPPEILERLKTNTGIEVIEDIDIQLLDEKHVIPNMGAVVFRGVWFPNLNMGETVN